MLENALILTFDAALLAWNEYNDIRFHTSLSWSLRALQYIQKKIRVNSVSWSVM